MPKKKPKRYATALFSIAREYGILDEIRESLKFTSALYDDPSFRLFFYSTKVEPDQKVKMLSSILEDRVHKTVLEFLGILAERKEHNLLKSTASIFEILYREQINMIPVAATTSFALKDDEYKQIHTRLETSLGKRVEMETDVDPQIIGGIKLRIGNTFLDGTIATQLEKMKQSLLQT